MYRRLTKITAAVLTSCCSAGCGAADRDGGGDAAAGKGHDGLHIVTSFSPYMWLSSM